MRVVMQCYHSGSLWPERHYAFGGEVGMHGLHLHILARAQDLDNEGAVQASVKHIYARECCLYFLAHLWRAALHETVRVVTACTRLEYCLLFALQAAPVNRTHWATAVGQSGAAGVR